MTGPDHYRAAERFLEEAGSGDDSSSRGVVPGAGEAARGLGPGRCGRSEL